MAKPEVQEWQVPRYDATEDKKLGWLNEAAEEGNRWNLSQRGAADWSKSLDILAGRGTATEALDYRSQMTSNRLKTNIRVAIGGLAAIRPWGGYQGRGEVEKYALVMNQATRALYLANFWDQSIKECLQWAAATNTGWARPLYRRNMAGRGHGNVEIDTFGTPSVLPIQMPANGDYQRAYAVTLMDEKPIWEAHGMFPLFQDRLKPTNSRYWYASEIRAAAVANAGRREFWNPFKRKKQDGDREHLIPIRYTTINDLAINTTGKLIPMGEHGSPWAYDVRSEGMLMKNGMKATINEARMYPFRRLIISSQDCVMYDGPAFNWHGELDLIPFCLDKWPWEPIGFSMVHDGWRIQDGIDKIDQGAMNKIMADMDRPLAYDMNAVSKREANIVDLMQPRQRIAFDGSAVDKPFTQIAPDDVYRVSPEAMKMREQLAADLDYTLQSRDIVELSKARALGKGMDQFEAVLSANGPLVKDMSRSMERSVCRIAHQTKYLILQYMDTARLIPYITEAKAETVFDYDPSTLIPSHLPGQPAVDAANNPLPSPTSRVERARWFADSLEFVLTPHSIHEIQQMTYRLMLMQLRQRGYHIAESDVLEANDVPEVKRSPGATTQARFWAEKEEEAEKMAKLQLIVAGLGIDVAALMGGAGGKAPVGRPPTGQSPPQLQTKSDGRPVISESES